MILLSSWRHDAELGAIWDTRAALQNVGTSHAGCLDSEVPVGLAAPIRRICRGVEDYLGWLVFLSACSCHPRGSMWRNLIIFMSPLPMGVSSAVNCSPIWPFRRMWIHWRRSGNVPRKNTTFTATAYAT